MTGTLPSIQFVITFFLVDQDPPIVSNCPSEHIIKSVTIGMDDTAVVTWQEPTAEDAAGPVRVVQSHRRGDSFPIGTTTVEYAFYDGVDNVAFCRFNVTVIGGKLSASF